MNRELTKKLCEKFPIIYRGRSQPITQNLMAFGFECGDGWYDILYSLSEKLEALAKDFNTKHPNSPCVNCSCDKDEHFASATKSPGRCLAVKRYTKKQMFKAYRANYWWQRPYMWLAYRIYRLNKWLHLQFNYRLQACWCEKYEPVLPLAVQVKEKYGTLRFYMHYSTDEMEELINQAEHLSAETCETCGNPGVLRGPGWYFTACDTHALRNGEIVAPVGNDES